MHLGSVLEALAITGRGAATLRCLVATDRVGVQSMLDGYQPSLPDAHVKPLGGSLAVDVHLHGINHSLEKSWNLSLQQPAKGH